MMTRDEAKARLLEILQPGSEVYTIVRHVSPSGISRVIDLYVLVHDEYTGKPKMRCIGYLAALVTGYKLHPKHSGLNVGGCGMDMCFHVVSRLSEELFGGYDKLSKVRL